MIGLGTPTSWRVQGGCEWNFWDGYESIVSLRIILGAAMILLWHLDMCKISNSKLILWDVQPPALSLKMKMVVSEILRGSTSMSVVGACFLRPRFCSGWYGMKWYISKIPITWGCHHCKTYRDRGAYLRILPLPCTKFCNSYYYMIISWMLNTWSIWSIPTGSKFSSNSKAIPRIPRPYPHQAYQSKPPLRKFQPRSRVVQGETWSIFVQCLGESLMDFVCDF